MKIPPIFGNVKREDLFMDLLDEENPDDRLYLYRLTAEGKSIKPAIYKGLVFADVLNWLRDKKGGGCFWAMIRRKGCLLVSGSIGVTHPRNSR